MGNLSSAEVLSALAAGTQVHSNLPVAQLVEIALAGGEARLAANGALVAYTGARTGVSHQGAIGGEARFSASQRDFNQLRNRQI